MTSFVAYMGSLQRYTGPPQPGMTSFVAKIEVLQEKIGSFTPKIEVLQRKVTSFATKIEALQRKIASFTRKMEALQKQADGGRYHAEGV